MPLSLKMSKNIKSTTRYLKYSYISIFTNLLRVNNETKSVKPMHNHINQKKIKRTKSRLKRRIKRLLNRNEKIHYVRVKQKNAKS